MSTTVFSVLAILTYAVCSAYIALHLIKRTNTHRLTVVGLGGLACVFHFAALQPLLLNEHGLWLGFFNAASLIALFIVMLVLLCMKRLALNLVLAPTQLLAALTVASAAFFPDGQSQPINEAPGILAHILLSILAYGVISIAVVQSAVLLLQDQQLRKRPVSNWVRNFPPLQTMESLLFSYLWAGWILLSLSLLTGWIFLDNLFAQHMVHKTFFSCLAWLIFAVLLWGRHQLGWRGNKAIRLTMVGFFLLMLAYFGSKLVREFILMV